MTAALKGAAVAAAGCVLVALQLRASPALEHYDDLQHLPTWMAALGAVAIPGGAGLGVLVSRLRSNRMLVGVAIALCFVMFVHVVMSGHPPSERAAHAIVLPAYLWAIAGGMVLAWWARPAPVEPVPTARWTRRIWLPRLRRPTVVEISVAIAIVCAIVIAFGVTDQSRHGEYSRWYQHTPLVDGGQGWLLAGVLSVVAIPCGVGIGLVASQLPSHPLMTVCAVLSGLGSAFYLSMLGPIEFPGWALGMVAVGGLAIAQVGTAMSREPVRVAAR